MAIRDFYGEQTDQSRVKAKMVAQYFWSWAKIIISKGRPRPSKIVYLDLFAGQGAYDDGSISTPLMVLERAIGDDQIRPCFTALFNDADEETIVKLKVAAQELEGFDSVARDVAFTTATVDDRLAEILERANRHPALMFVGPWGYKALSLRLINSVLRHPKSEVIFFFNYLRVNPAVSNPAMQANVARLLEPDRAAELQGSVADLVGIPLANQL